MFSRAKAIGGLSADGKLKNRCSLTAGEQSQQDLPPIRKFEGIVVLIGKAAEQPRQHLDRQEIVWTAADPARAIERYSTARHDHVDVRVMGHGRAPAVQHGW